MQKNLNCFQKIPKKRKQLEPLTGRSTKPLHQDTDTTFELKGRILRCERFINLKRTCGNVWPARAAAISCLSAQTHMQVIVQINLHNGISILYSSKRCQ